MAHFPLPDPNGQHSRYDTYECRGGYIKYETRKLEGKLIGFPPFFRG